MEREYERNTFSNILIRSGLMKILFSTIGIFLIIIGLVIALIIAITSQEHELTEFEGGGQPVSPEVMKWKPMIEEEVIRQGLSPQYTSVLLAILQQESGGSLAGSRGDIFQSSESKCGRIGCITDPRESISQAVKHFKGITKKSKGNLEIAIQSYNYGTGFADWIFKNGGKWTPEKAIEFSKMMMGKVSNPSNYTCIRKEAKPHGACYGDILYVQSVSQYIGKINGEEVGGGSFSNFNGRLVLPVSVPNITSEFGWRTLNGKKDLHRGIDFGCTEGMTKIYSAGDGIVIKTPYSSSLGNYVLIQHEKKLFTGYAHLHKKYVKGGERVKAGTPIGVCGNTGRSFGAHLHFTVQDGPFTSNRKDFNPRDFLKF